MTGILRVSTIQDPSQNNILNENSNTITLGKSGDTVAIASGATLTVDTLNVNGVPVTAITLPTVTSINPSTIENTQTQVTITGTNFVDGAVVNAISTTGTIVSADTVSFSNNTTLVCNFTLGVDGTYFIRVENPDGLAGRTSTALLTVSDAPTWVTASGSLGEIAQGDAMNFTVTATSDSTVAYSIVSGALPTGGSFNAGTGAITGTESGSDGANTTYNFTIQATDLESQSPANRAFSITVTVGITQGGQFN